MSKVLVILKIFPEGLEVDLEKLKEKINILIKPEKMELEDIAFGLKAIKVSKIIDDDGSILEEIENKLKTIEGVSSVEVIHITRTI